MRIPARLIAASSLTLIALAACTSKPHATTQSQQAASATQPSTNQLATTQPARVITRPPAVNTYHGVPVVDTYQWLENWEDPAVKSWSEAQNAKTREVLDNLPNVASIRERATQLLGMQSVSYYGFHNTNGRLFAMKREPGAQQDKLVWRSWPTDAIAERVLVDPLSIDSSGGTTIDWSIPSPDGSLLAVCMSKDGSEMGDVTIYDVASGQPREVIPRVNGGTAGGSLAWATDGSGFFYTRYPRAGEMPEADMNFYVQVYFHELGKPTSEDRFELGKGAPRIAEWMLDVKPDARGQQWVLASMQYGDGGEFDHFVRSPDQEGSPGTWTQVANIQSKWVQAALGDDGYVYAVSRANGAERGQVVRRKLGLSAMGDTQLIIPEFKDATFEIDFFDPAVFVISKDHILATMQTGGPSELRIFTKDGKAVKGPELFPVSAVAGTTPLEDGRILFSNVGFTQPLTWKLFDTRTGQTTVTSFGQSYPNLDLSQYEVRREFATSKDGTKVPVNIVMKRGTKLDGSAPLMLTGYGGYGVSESPRFSLRNIQLLEKGVIYALANIRGGGEYGEAWHRQGNLLNKQNVFDDFAACAQHLINNKYTSSNRLAIQGGSNGGLLMGSQIVQHPELYKCVVSHVGIYDMLRVELSPNGAFNITEFGTVTNPDQFKALYAYSPYHNVRENIKYPPVLFLTGANDPRVDPMQSRKMTAKLQEVGATALLRTSGNTGHGAGTPLSAQIEQQVDVMAWLFYHLNIN
ncbi:MAG TPA: prolyl oligopeptidase family serine peptidase [Phycisphaerales bacterium]|nr:prolyl oligopeptidase family serine peptidase [Phycisphaerales bacterium]